MTAPLRVLDIFSGIGGFSLGLERTGGFETVAFCEIDPFCRRVLAKHWPDVPCYDDVRTLTADRLAADGIAVDVICGGFPCQDISNAGKRAGIDGERSGLWREYARLIGELRPLFVVIENVPALRTRGADRVLSDLETLGYACEPAVVGAVHVGAPHRRQRAWLVARAVRDAVRVEPRRRCRTNRCEAAVARFDGEGRSLADAQGVQGSMRRRPSDQGGALAHAEYGRCEGWDEKGKRPGPTLPHGWRPSESDLGRMVARLPAELDGGGLTWATEPDIPRTAHGVKDRVHRLKALGNAVVPQVVEAIGRAILAAYAAGHTNTNCPPITISAPSQRASAAVVASAVMGGAP